MITRITPMATPQRTNFGGFAKKSWQVAKEKVKPKPLTETDVLRLHVKSAKEALEIAEMNLNDHLHCLRTGFRPMH